jgi:hypothetical protein
MSDVIKSKGDGSAQAYQVKADQAWDIAITVLRWEGCETIEEHRPDGYLLTTVSQNFMSAGCLVGVWVESINETNTKVTVVTKRRIQTSIATGLLRRRFKEDLFKLLRS